MNRDKEFFSKELKILKDINWIRRLAQNLDYQNKGLANECRELQLKQFVQDSEHKSLSTLFNQQILSKQNEPHNHQRLSGQAQGKRIPQ